jgi:hypothetical protein
MDTHRRRSHAAASEDFAGRLQDLLARVLDEYRFDLEQHGSCDSCLTNVAIFERKAQELGVKLPRR